MTRRRFLERERLGEFDHLAGREIEVGDAGPGVDVQFHLDELPARGRVERPPAHQAEADETAFVAEIDVLADRQIEQERLLLEHHTDADAVRL